MNDVTAPLPARRLPEWAALGLVVALGIELRLLFRTGLADLDALIYSHLARNVADGVFQLHYPGLPVGTTTRVGLYGPVAIFYKLFGVNEATTFAWTFLCAIAGILLAYAIARRVAGEAAGLLSAFVWTILPAGVAASTALMGDVPIATFSMGVVYAVLVAEHAKGWRWIAAVVGALACLVVGFASKPAVSLILVFLVVYAMWRRPRSVAAWVGLAAAVFAALIAYRIYTSQTSWSMSWLWLTVVPSTRAIVTASSDWWSHVVMGSPEFQWIAPLWIVAVAVLVATRRREASVPLLWLASLFLYLEFGTRSLAFYDPITTASLGVGITRHFLLIAAPAAVVTGIYLGQSLSAAQARVLVGTAAVLVGLIAWQGTRHATYLDWGITGETVLPFEAKSAVATAFVILAGMATPLFVMGALRPRHLAWCGLYLVALGVASLNPSYRAASVYRAVWPETMAEAVRFLQKTPTVPVFVQNPIFAQRLDYVSGFRLGHASSIRDVATPRIVLAPQDPGVIDDGLVLIDEYYLRASHDAAWGDGPAYFSAPPANFVEVARFGDRPGYRLRVYRVSLEAARQTLDQARTAALAQPTPAALKAWLGAAAGAHQYCEGAGVWQRMRESAPASLDGFDPIPLLRACLEAQPDAVRGPNLFVNGDFAKGRDAWGSNPDAKGTIDVVQDGRRGNAFHVNWSGGNWAVIEQQQTLKPDTAYVYEADLKTTADVIALYWGSDIGRMADMGRTFTNWTRLRYVFVTPHWEGKPWHASFNPVLMKAPGEAWIKSLQLSELIIPRR